MTQLLVDQVIAGSALGLSWGLSDILYAEIGGRRVVYVLSQTDEKLVELEIANDGTLTVVDELALNGPFQVGSAPSLELFDGKLVVAGLTSSQGQFVSLDANGHLGVQFSDADVGEISGGITTNGVLVSGAVDGDGLVSFRDLGGDLSWAASLVDDASTYLENVTGSAATTIGGTSYIAAISGSENGLTMVQVAADGTMSAGASFGTLDGLAISQPSAIETVEHVDGKYLVVAGSGSSSLSSLRLDENAEVWLSDHILDSSGTRFQAVSTIDSIKVGDFAYLAAGGVDGGISLLSLLPGGRMVHLATFADTSSTSLYRTSAVSMIYANNALQILGGSAWEAGLTRLSYDLAMQGSVLLADSEILAGTALDDQLIGSDTADTLNGGAGNDVLYDGHGEDILTGGGGEDLFVFALDGVEDVVLDFERGVDRLDLSGFDFLYDVSQLSIVSESDGAVVTFAGETIRLYSEDGGSLSALDFTNASILNVDRPPMLTVSQTLVGSNSDDILNGNTGDDTISGLGGDDLLSGGSGDDDIFGGDGADTLDGGAGRDVIDGGAGADLIIGSLDEDLIEGGAGNDVIYGDEIA